MAGVAVVAEKWHRGGQPRAEPRRARLPQRRRGRRLQGRRLGRLPLPHRKGRFEAQASAFSKHKLNHQHHTHFVRSNLHQNAAGYHTQ